MTNTKFSLTNEVFKRACALARVLPTRRQASKYLNQRGSAFPYKRAAIIALQEDVQNASHE